MKTFLFSTVAALTLVLSACVNVTRTSDANHTMSHDAMTMDDMVQMLEGKTGDEFDRAFIDGMIEHHQGAIDMARLALEYAGHEEIQDMARDIINAQQTEIDQMEQWKREWNL